MDVVIPVRNSPHNESLRFALRSFAANLPHDRVWLVGGKPPWARNVGHIPTRQGHSKYANTTLAVRTACEHPDVSTEFLLCNDDFFTMRPVPDPMPVYHRGQMIELEKYLQRKYRGRGKYLQGLRQTRQLLERLGFPNPLSYEVHVPLPINKTVLLKTLELGHGIGAFHKRTAYAVISGLGGTRIRDPKVLSLAQFPKNTTFLSTSAESFRRGQVGAHIRATFPKRCRYEGGR